MILRWIKENEHTLSLSSRSDVKHCCCSSLQRAVDNSRLSADFFVLRFCSSKLDTDWHRNKHTHKCLCMRIRDTRREKVWNKEISKGNTQRHSEQDKITKVETNAQNYNKTQFYPPQDCIDWLDYRMFFIVALWNRIDHYIFILSFVLSSSSFSFPRLISAAAD